MFYYMSVGLLSVCDTSQVSSVNKYDPPLDVMAARDHMTHLVYQLMQPQVLYDRLVQIHNIIYLLIVK